MSQVSQDPAQLQGWIDRLQSGDPGARDELLGHACDRLRRLTRKMLRGYARLRRWEETDDVLNSAMLRLWTALRQVTPRTVREFYGLASLQIRRELLDLVRQCFGPEGIGAHHASHGEGGDSAVTPRDALDDTDTTYEPSRLAVWTEFHERVETLPEEEREVFDLLWYQGVKQPEAARLLGVSEPTLKRRWWSARRRLHTLLRGQLPGA